MAQKVIRPSLPIWYRIHETAPVDNTTTKTNIIYIDPTNGQNQSNLNKGQVIRFNYTGEDKFIRMGSPRSGFRIRAGFITQSPAGTNAHDANTTLASNWFAHMFSAFKLRLGSSDIETVDKPGVVMDILRSTKGLDYRQRSGECYGYIPDEGNGAASSVAINATATWTAGAAYPAATTVVNCTSVTSNNNNFNNGFKRRKEKYNYTAGNDEVREVEEFIPLSDCFGFCEYYDRVLKYIGIQFELTRKSETDKNASIFGGAGTTIMFGDNATTGILELRLELEEYIPSLEVEKVLNERFSKGPVDAVFLERSCDSKNISDQQTYDMSETKYSVPRYVFVVAKGTTGGADQNLPTANFQLCRHANMKEIKVILDSREYPDKSQNADFDKNQYSAFYQAFAGVCESMGGSCAISAKEYRDLYSIFAIDCSDQVEKVNNNPTNLKLKISRRAIPADNNLPLNPKNIEYYILILNEKRYKINVIDKTCVLA